MPSLILLSLVCIVFCKKTKQNPGVATGTQLSKGSRLFEDKGEQIGLTLWIFAFWILKRI